MKVNRTPQAPGKPAGLDSIVNEGFEVACIFVGHFVARSFGVCERSILVQDFEAVDDNVVVASNLIPRSWSQFVDYAIRKPLPHRRQ